MSFHFRSFAQLAVYCEKQGSLIPVSFVLGFYVTIVVGRWWDQYLTIPFPDAIALFVSASIHGQVFLTWSPRNCILEDSLKINSNKKFRMKEDDFNAGQSCATAVSL